MIESVEDVRTWCDGLFQTNSVKVLKEKLDAIEREVNEKYIELPEDANGKTVRCGGYVKVYPYDGKPMKVKALRLSGFGWSVVFEDGSREHLYRVLACEPLTVEDVLEEALNRAANLDRKEDYWPSAADITNIVNEIAPKLQIRKAE